MITFVVSIYNLILFVRFATTINVGGVLLQNTVWTKANNPYNVIADVQIPKNATLTIKPGVQIIYGISGDYGMLVKGFLQVQGTAEQPVIFNGSKATNNNKYMLNFQATNLSQSLIVHADFIGPKGAAQLSEVSIGTPINKGEFVLQFCTFATTQIHTFPTLFDTTNTSIIPVLTVQNSTITDSVVSNSPPLESSPQIIKLLGNYLHNVTINAIAHYNGMRMADCRGGNVSIYWRGYNKAYFQINNTVLTNVFIQHYNYYGIETFFSIRGSTLLNATILLIGASYDGTIDYLDIISSKITVPQAIEIEAGSIQCSTITNFGDNSNSTGVLARSILISNSSIFNFNVGLTIIPYTSPMGNITNSNFYSNTLYNILNTGASDLNAIGNWWGRKNNIDATIYDYWDNINYGEIIHTNDAQSRIEQSC